MKSFLYFFQTRVKLTKSDQKFMAFAILKYIFVQNVLIIHYHVTVFITGQAESRGDYDMANMKK